MRLGVAAAIAGGTRIDGDVTVEDGRVTGVGVQPAGSEDIAVPGFVDAHINGFAGVDFLATDAAGYRDAAAAMAATGVVAFQPTLISLPRDAYPGALAVAAEAACSLPAITGVHLEGPFLSPSWAGAHEPANLLEPDAALLTDLCDAGPVAMVTLAPELRGATDLIDLLTARGVVVSCGHSDADAATAGAAFARGARAITHVYNAHRRWQPRDPGLGGAALVTSGVTVQAIADGVHLAPESVRLAQLAAGERFSLVTDAIEAAAMPAGDWMLQGRAVRVQDGAARLADGTLAGSVLTMDRAVRNLVDWGATLEQAAHAAATAPARLLRRGDLGRLEPGSPANITVLDHELRVMRTLVGGIEAFAK